MATESPIGGGWVVATGRGRIRVAPAETASLLPVWRDGRLARTRKDRRFYRIVEQTIPEAANTGYFVVEDETGRVLAAQPFFLCDIDLLHGIGLATSRWLARLRRRFPRLGIVRMLMVGCLVGEAHLDRLSDRDTAFVAATLHDGLLDYARACGAQLAVLKEFPSEYRAAFDCFSSNGYARVPSFPMTELELGCGSFDGLLSRLGRSTRKSIRRKLRQAEAAGPIEFEVTTDVSGCVEELYRLYLNVYDRARFRLERLTPEFLVRLGSEMPDAVRFFLWRHGGRIVAFSLCTIEGGTLYDEYLGLDYDVAYDLSLYMLTLRDVLQWAIENGFTRYCSTALSYEPKRRLRSALVPLDIYVAHTSPLLNHLCKRLLPLLEPTHRDAVLRRFPDYEALRATR